MDLKERAKKIKDIRTCLDRLGVEATNPFKYLKQIVKENDSDMMEKIEAKDAEIFQEFQQEETKVQKQKNKVSKIVRKLESNQASSEEVQEVLAVVIKNTFR